MCALNAFSAYNMNKLDKVKLAELLVIWFKETSGNRNRWNNDKVGRILKSNLINCGNWKKNSNGCGRKAFQAMRYAVAVQNGYEGPQIDDF